jgi:phosphoribosylglycinamide formyltransferase 1
MSRLAVMLSGSGRTLLNLIEQIRSGKIPATIDVVIASRECPGAQRAREAGIDTVVMPGVIPMDRLADALRQRRIDWVVLAGYLKFVQIPAAYRGRVVNIHPSLLPAFGGAGMYGDRVHEAVLRAGVKESGCTVHLVDEEYDHGPVVLQRSCPVHAGDTPHTLADRVFALELETYPEALRMLLAGRTPAARPDV